MNIAVFGGTGGLGKALVTQGLEAGHEVLVLARTPEKMTVTHDALTVVQGDGMDPRSAFITGWPKRTPK